MSSRRVRTASANAVPAFLNRVADRHLLGALRPRRPVSFEEFRQTVRRVRPSELLPALAAIAVTAESISSADDLSRVAAPWTVALVARESVLWGNEYRRAGLSVDDLSTIFNAANNIFEVDDSPDSLGLLSVLTRIVYEQFPYQESIFEEVTRTHALLVDGTDEIDAEVVSDKAWRRLFDAPLDQVVGATFFLHVAANANQGWFDYAWLDRPDLVSLFATWRRKVIIQRAEQLAITFEEFKEDYKNCQNHREVTSDLRITL